MSRLAEEKSQAEAASSVEEDGTRHALLDAAERLFAEKGVDGSSVRDITGLAKANLGAINYYFGTKDRLVFEVFVRRLEPLDRERLARLDALETHAGGKPLVLEEILSAMVEPVIGHLIEGDGPDFPRLKLVNRCFHEMNPELKALLKENKSELIARFDRALMNAVEGLSERATFWLVTFTNGAMIQMLNTWTGDGFRMPGNKKTVALDETRELTQSLICFAAAGIRASAAAKSIN